MIFKIKNFGKISEANIKLDGITVICGDNNTGKSTVGKALFSFFNALTDYKNKIDTQKNNKLRAAVRNYASHSMDLPVKALYPASSIDFISEHDNHFSLDEVKELLAQSYGVKLPKDRLVSLVEYLNTSEIDILNEYVYRYITNVMNGQVKNAYSSNNSNCLISGKFKDFTNTIKIKKQSCTCELNEPVEHSAYYINTPFSLDSLNEHRMALFGGNSMSRNIVDAILQAQAEINEDSMTNILDTVLNKKELDDVRGIIKKAYSGDTIIDHGRYFYVENGISVDFRNISAGLKSFAIIERLLETGVLKKKDVLILDEPEIHLHSEWQIIYAELIVILQKTFDLTILLVTHSSHFLESLIYYMEKYEIADKGNYYIPVKNEKGVTIVDGTENLVKMKKSLKSGMYTIANMKLEELTSGDTNEEDNE
ncbi:AAA family ATPase [Eubacterium sp.]|uniref:AAA family ATPase n=1 Tax=Eubacterium sp. TaxID=142586 RepID=UPI002582BF69|nr:AAA family ATPase [Eubacterium sp.]MCR5368918.1 AAA family ATPase [Eubacterium sp.]